MSLKISISQELWASRRPSYTFKTIKEKLYQNDHLDYHHFGLLLAY